MNIKNDCVIIKHGKKKYELRNYILTNYLRQFAVYQSDTDYVGYNKAIDEIYLKFNEEIETINENTVLLPSDFDLKIDILPYIVSDIKENQIIINYDFNVESSLLKEYEGLKITAIGFRAHNGNSNDAKDERLAAIIDVSNYDIYIQPKSDFNISRRDIITTNAKFWSPFENVKGPIHLSPNGMGNIIPSVTYNDTATAIIYSVGFGTYINHMEYEFFPGEDIGIIVDSELSGVAENEVWINSFYFTKADDVQLYPNNNLHPSSNLYPLETNMKLLIIKYKIWQKVYDGNNSENVDTGLYYHIAIPYDVPYQHNLRIKYERG